MYKIDELINNENLLIARELYLIQKRGDIGIHTADSICYAAETKVTT